MISCKMGWRPAIPPTMKLKQKMALFAKRFFDADQSATTRMAFVLPKLKQL